ncbi:hypothetical protein OUZ56_012617 [Daphnia magna]|uniref:Uncharacterized protein n=1 Tax=Daphnia magna TaxID=35525 RepID=A0ABQ9Z3R3_9CRUS|nr:hypothetical protein OUZ56_012617 [Daphnia magna]
MFCYPGVLDDLVNPVDGNQRQTTRSKGLMTAANAACMAGPLMIASFKDLPLKGAKAYIKEYYLAVPRPRIFY